MRHEQDSLRKRVYINCSSSCNNSCIFCTDSQPDGTFIGSDRKGLETIADMNAVVSQIPEGMPVILSGREPTLNPRIFYLIELLKRKGSRRVGLVTNGRMLSYMDYCRKLFEAGVSEVMVSLHGSCPSVHDSITRVEGSFEQTVKGVSNAAKLKSLFPGAFISCNVTVARTNLADMKNIWRKVASIPGVDNLVFHGLKPLGRALASWKSMAVRYAAVLEKFREILKSNCGSAPRLRLEDVPQCAAAKHLSKARRGSSAAGGRRMGGTGMPVSTTVNAAVFMAGRSGLHRDAGGDKQKFAFCSDCRHSPHCDGVYKKYVDLFGIGEFHEIPKQS